MSNKTIDNFLDAASSYAAKGWRVLPVHTVSKGSCSCGKASCGSKGKHPRMNKWQETATTSSNIVESWWGTKWPGASIGIATGRDSNLFVLDVDGSEGEATLQALVTQYGPVPDTLIATTGRGRHFYFRYPDRPIKTSAGSVGVGLDIRSDGGYVIAPPSRHSSGKTYSWENPEAPLQDAPEWLIDLLSGDQEAVQEKPSAPATFDESEGPIFEGTRNTTLFKQACALRGQGMEQEQIEEILMKINQEQCLPPLDAKEVEQIAASAGEYQPGTAPSLMTRKKDPLWWFQFDVNEWCADQRVIGMSDYQRGWYISLLAACWKSSGYLPNDPDKLARIAGAEDRDKFKQELAEVLWAFELCDDGVRIVHSRLNAHWNDKVVKVDQSSKAGKKSAGSRAEKQQKEAA